MQLFREFEARNLTACHINVYLGIVAFSGIDEKILSSKLGYSKEQISKVLEDLLEKNLITSVSHKSEVCFFANEPSFAYSEQDAFKTCSLLSRIFLESLPDARSVAFFVDTNTSSSVSLDYVLKTTNLYQEIQMFASVSTGPIAPEVFDAISVTLDSLVALDLQVKIIISETGRHTVFPHFALPSWETRFFDDSEHHETSYILTGNVIRILSREHGVNIVVENARSATLARSVYDLAWGSAQPLEKSLDPIRVQS